MEFFYISTAPPQDKEGAGEGENQLTREDIESLPF
jgi:hypothetical protein